MLNMQDMNNDSVMVAYLAPTRGLLGFRYQFLTSTRGDGRDALDFHDYDARGRRHPGRSRGSLVAWETGETTTYGLKNAEDRGTLFVGPGVSVYEGMVIGENTRGQDMPINVCKKKHLTNIRSAGGDMEIRLTPPRRMSLDERWSTSLTTNCSKLHLSRIAFANGSSTPMIAVSRRRRSKNKWQKRNSISPLRLRSGQDCV
jgi:GTP-binding protein